MAVIVVWEGRDGERGVVEGEITVGDIDEAIGGIELGSATMTNTLIFLTGFMTCWPNLLPTIIINSTHSATKLGNNYYG